MVLNLLLCRTLSFSASVCVWASPYSSQGIISSGFPLCSGFFFLCWKTDREYYICSFSLEAQVSHQPNRWFPWWWRPRGHILHEPPTQLSFINSAFRSRASVTWLHSWSTSRGLTTKSVFNKACYGVPREILSTAASPYGWCFARMHRHLRHWTPSWLWQMSHSVLYFCIFNLILNLFTASPPRLNTITQKRGRQWKVYYYIS